MKKSIVFILLSFIINCNVIKGQGFNNTYEIINEGLALQRAIEMDSCYIMSNNVSGVGFPTLDREMFFKINNNGTLIQSKEFVFSKEFLSGEQPALCKISDSIFFFFHTVITDGSIIMAKMNTNLDTLWVKFYGADSLYPKFVRDAYYDSQTSTMVLCGRKKISSSVSDIWLLRVSITDGTVMFDSTYNVSNVYHYVNKMMKSNDNGYLITGTQFGKWTLLKLDSLLHKQWIKQYYKYGGYEACVNAVQLPDSGFLLVGSFYTNHYQDDNYKCGIMRIDKNGNEQWRKLYGYKGPYSYFNNIFPTTDGNFICIGNTDSVYTHSTSGYMLKINLNGDELWHRYFYAGMIKEYPTSLNNAMSIVTGALQTLDGGYFMCGHYYDCSGNYFNGCYNAFAIKTDDNGCDGWGSCDTNLRIKTIVTSYNTNDTLFQRDPYLQPSIIESDTANYVCNLDTICTGERLLFEFMVLGGRDSMDYTIEIYSQDSSHSIPYPYGYQLKASLYNIKDSTKYYYVTDPINWYLAPAWPSGTVVNGGWFKIIGSYNYGPDLYNTVGVIIDTTCSVGINELNVNENKINIYPNPATTELNIQLLSNNQIQLVEANIYNMLGKLVATYPLKSEFTKLNILNLTKGFYSLELISTNSKRVFYKLVKN